MALTKVTKHIVYGSVLVAHYGQDYANITTSSSSYVQWGEDTVLTPQYSDSHLNGYDWFDVYKYQPEQ